MQTLQPTLRLGRDVWDRTAMPIEAFRDRARQLRQAMGERGLDAMLLYGAGLNGCGYPTYISNYIVKLPFSALVVLPREGEPALMFEGATRGRSAAQATTWIEDVRPCWKIAETTLAALAERGLMSATIGLAGLPRLVPDDEWCTLAAGLGNATLVDVDGIVDRQRAIKSDREIAQIGRASHIVEDALARAPEKGLAAADESQLAALVMREARMRGAEDIRLQLARPDDHDWAFQPAGERAFRDGDSVSVHLAASWERYWSESIRTYVVRTDRFELVWNSELDARFQGLVAAATPGIAVGDWVRAADATMSASERKSLEPYGLGHGIGVTPEEWPTLEVESQATLESGMCLVVRAAFAGDRGLVVHGDTIVVASTRAR
jgi:Xaa-Pro aminopeptidase